MTCIQQSKIVVESSLVQDEDLSEGIEHDQSQIKLDNQAFLGSRRGCFVFISSGALPNDRPP